MKELMESQNSIVFIDELHTLVGAGSAEGSLDAANILKPALSRGEIQCIGATTRANTASPWRRTARSNAGSSREVGAPSEDEAIQSSKGCASATKNSMPSATR